MARIEKRPTAPFSPFYGCFIIVTAVVVFGGLVTWVVYSLLSQDRQISEFTVDEPAPLSAVILAPDARAALDKKLAEFSAAAKSGQAATLSLTVPELNTLIVNAPDTGSGSYRDMIRIRATDPQRQALIADVCLPMNRAKFWEGKKRYLIGDAVFVVSVTEEGVDAKVIDVKVPGKDVPAGFIGVFASFGWVAPYRTTEPIGTVLKVVKKAAVTPEGVTLSTTAP